jgi:hypothetical protein
VIQIHLRVVSDASLGRPAAPVMLYTIAHEHAKGTVIHLHGKIHGQLPVDGGDASSNIVIQTEIVCTFVTLVQGVLVRILSIFGHGTATLFQGW